MNHYPNTTQSMRKMYSIIHKKPQLYFSKLSTSLNHRKFAYICTGFIVYLFSLTYCYRNSFIYCLSSFAHLKKSIIRNISFDLLLSSDKNGRYGSVGLIIRNFVLRILNFWFEVYPLFLNSEAMSIIH